MYVIDNYFEENISRVSGWHKNFLIGKLFASFTALHKLPSVKNGSLQLRTKRIRRMHRNFQKFKNGFTKNCNSTREEVEEIKTNQKTVESVFNWPVKSALGKATLFPVPVTFFLQQSPLFPPASDRAYSPLLRTGQFSGMVRNFDWPVTLFR